MQKHAQNILVVRLYARWQEEVKYNPWSAQKWFG